MPLRTYLGRLPGRARTDWQVSTYARWRAEGDYGCGSGGNAVIATRLAA